VGWPAVVDAAILISAQGSRSAWKLERFVVGFLPGTATSALPVVDRSMAGRLSCDGESNPSRRTRLR